MLRRQEAEYEQRGAGAPRYSSSDDDSTVTTTSKAAAKKKAPQKMRTRSRVA